MRGKRIFITLLALLLALTAIPIPVRAAKGDKLVALTFDDGPNKTYTKQLLDGLKETDAKVTFFMVGNAVSSNLSLVKRAYDEGHEIANHSYSHPSLSSLSYSGVQSQITSTSSALNKACGSGTSYIVRPPYGSANSTVLSAIGAPAILWSVDTNDWKVKNSTKVYNSIVNNASDGAIILCHDIHSTTIPGALSAIKTLEARGYEFVTVSELFRRRGVSMYNGQKYTRCAYNGVDYGPVQAPVISYEPAEEGAKITITSPSGAPVYYSVNGSRIIQGSTRYNGSFVTSLPANIQAVAAYDLNGDRSTTTTLNLTLPPCHSPELTVADGYATLTCATEGAPIYYTLDGTKASDKSAVYEAPVPVEPGTVIRAIAGGGKLMFSKEIQVCYSDNGNLFSDVFPDKWYYESIDELATLKLMAGVGGYAFAPEGKTTRAMLVTLLYRYSGEKLEEGWERTNTFKDVADGTWYSEAVEWAYRTGVINGYPDNTFGHDKLINRQEVAKVFAGFLEYRGLMAENQEDSIVLFKDLKKIHTWALASVNDVVSYGLMVGDTKGNFNPLNPCTRAEAGAVLIRLLHLEEELESQPPVEEPEEDPEETPDENIEE